MVRLELNVIDGREKLKKGGGGIAQECAVDRQSKRNLTLNTSNFFPT